MPPAPRDPQHWRRYKALRNLFLFLWIAYLPAAVLALGPLTRAARTQVPALILVALWMLLFVVVGTRVAAWPCPRCGKPFSRRSYFDRRMFTRKCVHCGLPKYAPDHRQ